MENDGWPEGANVYHALVRVQHRLTARKARLLACACARTDWRLLRAESSRRAVLLAERHADGLVAGDRLAVAHEEATAAVGRRQNEAPAATAAALAAAPELGYRDHTLRLGAALAELSRLGGAAGECRFVPILRDLLRPAPMPAFPAHWHTPDVATLASQAYEARDGLALRVLGDALEDAGCDWPHLLAHCRGPCRHVRGCWALDLILGRE